MSAVHNNNVYNVLIPDGSLPPTAVGTHIHDIGVGEIGVFGYEDQTALDGSTIPKSFFIALGVDDSGDGNVDRIEQSSGVRIWRKHIHQYNYRGYVEAKPSIVRLKNYKAMCGTTYTFKLDLFNDKIMSVVFPNTYSNRFSVTTGCCKGCDCSCANGNCNELTKKMVEALNNADTTFYTATAYATEAITTSDHGTSADYAVGDVISEADLDILIAFNDAAAEEDRVCTGVEITSSPMQISDFCNISLNYNKIRGTEIKAFLQDGFDCNGEVEYFQDMVLPELSGADLKELENFASAWNGKGSHYKFTYSGLPKPGTQLNADSKKNYHMMQITYDAYPYSGSGGRIASMETIVAFDADGSNIARDGLLGILDAILEDDGLGPMLDDATAQDGNPDIPSIDNSDEDGIS